MPTSTEEIKVLETFAKFEALQELLEEAISEETPSKTEFKNVSANYPVFEDLYLEIRVTQQKSLVIGQELLGAERNDGPVCQKLRGPMFSSLASPLVAISAGFKVPGT